MKILGYAEVGGGLGHISRYKKIIDEFKGTGTEFVIVSNSRMPIAGARIIDRSGILSARNIKEFGSLDEKFFKEFNKVVKEEKPDTILFDTFYSIEICKRYPNLIRVLILRKYFDEDLKGFFDCGYDRHFDKIIIPHNKEEFSGFKIPRRENIEFIGPIVDTKVKDQNTKKTEGKDKTIILGTVAGGGFHDAKDFVECCINAFKKLRGKVDAQFMLQTGPFLRDKPKIPDFIKEFDYSDSFTGILADASIVVCQGGYNTLIELAYLNKKAIVIPSKKINDDQAGRARYMQRFGFKVLEKADSDKLSELVIDSLKEKEEIHQMEIGNYKIFPIIMELFEPKLIRTGKACNNNCVFCRSLGIKAQKERSADEVIKEAELRKSIIFPCNFEIRKDFIMILSRLENKNITLQSNGRIFYYKDLVNKCMNHIRKFEIFLEGDEEVHDRISGIRSFKQTYQGIKNLVGSGADVTINIVIARENIFQMMKILEIIEDLGVKKIRLIFPIKEKSHKYSIPEISKSYKIIDEFIQKSKEKNIAIKKGELIYNPFLKGLDLTEETSNERYASGPENPAEDKKEKADDKRIRAKGTNMLISRSRHKISIIIPAYNRKELLESTLISLSCQDFPKEQYEVIVVDDGSDDESLERVKNLSLRCQLKYIYWPRGKRYIFDEPGNRSGPARNIGVKHATGDIILFWDSDMIASPELLKEHLRSYDPSYSTSGIRKRLKKDFMKKGLLLDQIKNQKLVIKSYNLLPATRSDKMLLEKGYRIMDMECPWFFHISNNLLISKSVFERTGGFSSNFIFWGGEDQELGYRLLKMGIRFKVNTNAIGYHQFHPEEFTDYNRSIRNFVINAEILYKTHLDREIFEFYKKEFRDIEI